MEEVDTIILDDNIEYVILEEENIEGTTYTLFSNINDDKDICFRKTIIEDGKEYYTKLDDEAEFKKVITYFNKKLNG